MKFFSWNFLQLTKTFSVNYRKNFVYFLFTSICNYRSHFYPSKQGKRNIQGCVKINAHSGLYTFSTSAGTFHVVYALDEHKVFCAEFPQQSHFVSVIKGLSFTKVSRINHQGRTLLLTLESRERLRD
jgi:hypothetical protein